MVIPEKLREWGLFFVLYFFEGAPIGLIWWTIPTILSINGVSVATITTMSATATMPWTLKFVLGPVVDRYITRVRGYAHSIAVLQCGVLLGLAGLLWVSPSSPTVLSVVLIISVFSAAQDVVIDAWAIASVPTAERGRINGAMQAGMLTGRWVFGAGLLIFLSAVSFESAIYFLMSLVGASIVFLGLYYRSRTETIAPVISKLSLGALSFVFHKKFLLLAGVALLTGFALEGFTTVVSPYLVANGFSREEVGWTLSVTLAAMLLGSISGGFLADKLGDVKTFFGVGILLALVVVLLGGLMGLSSGLIVGGVLGAYFLVGMFTAASYTYYMNQCHGAMEATKFTFLMAITNLCEVTAAYSVGQLIVWRNLGYSGAFQVCAVISVVGLMVLLVQRNVGHRVTR